MSDSETALPDIARIGEDLFQYAIDRVEMNIILDALPLEAPDQRATLEHEIQLLRIVSVGWAIAYFLVESPWKTPLGSLFWENVRSFSSTLSTSASLTVGTDIDYFDILKQRLDHYVAALDAAGSIPEPATAIGPAFAGVCGDKNDACAILAGSKMFFITLQAVREYLDQAVMQGSRDRRV